MPGDHKGGRTSAVLLTLLHQSQNDTHVTEDLMLDVPDWCWRPLDAVCRYLVTACYLQNSFWRVSAFVTAT